MAFEFIRHECLINKKTKLQTPDCALQKNSDQIYLVTVRLASRELASVGIVENGQTVFGARAVLDD